MGRDRDFSVPLEELIERGKRRRIVHLEVDLENGGGCLPAVPGGEDLLLVQYGDPRLHRVFKCLHTKKIAYVELLSQFCRFALRGKEFVEILPNTAQVSLAVLWIRDILIRIRI